MLIVGITGNIANGKTTFGENLAAAAGSAQHWESWQVIAEIASGLRTNMRITPSPDDLVAINEWLSPLPKLVEAAVHKTLHYDNYRLTRKRLADHPDYFRKLQEYLLLMQARPELRRVPLTTDNKELFRSLLQWLGGYLVELLGEGTWYDEILQRIKMTQNIELATIGGVRFPGEAGRIKQAGGWVVDVTRPGLNTRDATDLTERHRQLVHTDTQIVNNGSLNELEVCAVLVYEDLIKGKLKPIYRAIVA